MMKMRAMNKPIVEEVDQMEAFSMIISSSGLMTVFLMIQVISYLRMAELPCMKIKYEVHDHNEKLTGWVGA